MYTIRKSVTFSAAHALRNYDGKCSRNHGHDYRVELIISARELDHRDLLIDYYDVDALLDPLLERVDHRNLNEIPPFDKVNPSAEAIAAWFFRELKDPVSRASNGRAHLAAVTLWETPDASATYTEE